MKRLNSPILYALAITLTSFFLGSCDEDPSGTDPVVDGNFFPLDEGKQWSYQYAYFTLGKDSVESSSESLTITIEGDSTIDGKTYKMFVDQDGDLMKLARQEGTKFYGRRHELYGITHEYMFLDTSVPVGGSWSYLKDGGYSKTEYIVKAHHEVHRINNVAFMNVLELEVNYYTKNDAGEMVLMYSAQHFYTDGLGESYAFYPAEATGRNEDLNITLVGYHGQ